ncbi:FadR family transcriptional regulator [Niallia endozanthoxylica]|uniref:FadR family transcriptional regulator n=2 Tax=Niallia endozanthoxylica TaxID=2036016 RepID=A0A5J5IAQ7_9BACI|nr:FadR family transcriptional regulator [Niallia endozanthoxylica]
MIKEDHLKPGDKLPSERELSERLNVGRSSVREALRALELLGLIETKRGEGTFIRDFKGHQLIPLLGTFILQDEASKRDVKETKHLIERNCLSLILKRAEIEAFLTDKRWTEDSINDDEFFLTIAQLADNHLLLRIWVVLADYYNSLQLNEQHPVKEHYDKLLTALANRDEVKTAEAYRLLRGLSNE